ncbi:MAG: hypothetical protein J0L94_02490 [Rhodothermia bacterium]|nr:hypothetical protein [Rhodothermia bacterium]
MRNLTSLLLLLILGFHAQAQTKQHQLFLGINRGAFPPADMLTLGIHAGYTYPINNTLGLTLRLVQHQSNEAIAGQQAASAALETNLQVLPVRYNRVSFGFEAGLSARNLVTSMNKGITYVNNQDVYIKKHSILYEFGGIQSYLLMPIKLGKKTALVTRAGYVYYKDSFDAFDLSVSVQVSL